MTGYKLMEIISAAGQMESEILAWDAESIGLYPVTGIVYADGEVVLQTDEM